MKKNRYIIIIVLALIAVSACAILMILKSGEGRNLTAANNSLKTQWSEYTKSVGENDAILKAALSEAKFSVKDIEEGTPSSIVTVEVDSKRLGEELKEYNENNAEPVKKDGANAVLLKLIDDAEETDKLYKLTAKPKADKSGYEYNFTPEFINAMLGYVFSEEQLESADFGKNALSEFGKAFYVKTAVEYDYKKIDSIMKNATSVKRYENKIYYAEYQLINETEDSSFSKRKLKCYDIESGSDETIKTFDCEWVDSRVQAAYIGCLSEGVVMVEETDDFNSDDYKLDSYIYDYREGKINQIKAKNSIPAYEAAVIADYKDGTVYYAAGQDGFGDVNKFAVNDDAETVAIDLNGDYIMMNSMYVRNGKIYTDYLDYECFEKSGYKDEIYNICVNSGTSIGDKVIENIDGAFYSDSDDTFVYMKGGALINYSISTGAETEIVKTDVKYKNADVRFIAGDYAYIVIGLPGEEGYTPMMYKINMKTGEAEQFKDAKDYALNQF